MDNTLVNLVAGWIKWLKKEKYINITATNILNQCWISETYGEHANEYWKRSGIYENEVLPIPGAINFIKALKYIYGENNIIIISNSVRNMVNEKTKYALEVFEIINTNFLHTSEKWKYTEDGILIDDAPCDVLDHVKSNHTPAILFNYRNRYGWAKLDKPNKLVHTCTNYAECITILSKIQSKYFPKEY